MSQSYVGYDQIQKGKNGVPKICYILVFLSSGWKSVILEREDQVHEKTPLWKFYLRLLEDHITVEKVTVLCANFFRSNFMVFLDRYQGKPFPIVRNFMSMHSAFHWNVLRNQD